MRFDDKEFDVVYDPGRASIADLFAVVTGKNARFKPSLPNPVSVAFTGDGLAGSVQLVAGRRGSGSVEVQLTVGSNPIGGAERMATRISVGSATLVRSGATLDVTTELAAGSKHDQSVPVQLARRVPAGEHELLVVIHFESAATGDSLRTVVVRLPVPAAE